MTGVDASDFAAAATGRSPATVTSVSGSDQLYTVTVSGVTGDGTLGLDLNASGTAIEDDAGNVAVGYTGGPLYTVDNTPPTASSIALAGASPNNASWEFFTVTFSEPVYNVTASDFTLVSTGTAAGAVAGTVAGTVSNPVPDGDLDHLDVWLNSVTGTARSASTSTLRARAFRTSPVRDHRRVHRRGCLHRRAHAAVGVGDRSRRLVAERCELGSVHGHLQ